MSSWMLGEDMRCLCQSPRTLLLTAAWTSCWFASVSHFSQAPHRCLHTQRVIVQGGTLSSGKLLLLRQVEASLLFNQGKALLHPLELLSANTLSETAWIKVGQVLVLLANQQELAVTLRAHGRLPLPQTSNLFSLWQIPIFLPPSLYNYLEGNRKKCLIECWWDAYQSKRKKTTLAGFEETLVLIEVNGIIIVNTFLNKSSHIL